MVNNECWESWKYIHHWQRKDEKIEGERGISERKRNQGREGWIEKQRKKWRREIKGGHEPYLPEASGSPFHRGDLDTCLFRTAEHSSWRIQHPLEVLRTLLTRPSCLQVSNLQELNNSPIPQNPVIGPSLEIAVVQSSRRGFLHSQGRSVTWYCVCCDI